MKWKSPIWLRKGIVFFIIVFAFHRPVVPINAFWYSADFIGLNNSTLRITGDVDYLEWVVDQNYPVIFTVFWRSLGTNVSRLYNITLECKWVAAAGQEENISRANGPYELTRRFQKAQATFVFFPTKASFGLEDGKTKNGSLQYKISFNEDLPGNDTAQSTDWQDAFPIQIQAPGYAAKSDYEFDNDLVLTIATIITIGSVSLAVYSTFRGSRKPKRRKRKKLLASWMKTCPICEKLNDFDAVFCKRCGAQL